MGLISFVKSAGAKLAGAIGLGGGDAEEKKQAVDEERQRQINLQRGIAFAKAVESHGIEIDDLKVTVDGETATVSGTAKSQADAEKAILIVGNHEGVGGVDDQLEVEVPEPPAVYHTVVSGDSLSKISLAQYGVIHLYDQIFEANKPMLEHPDKIYPGQVLRIPPVSAPIHEVKSGETLGGIAKHWYGDAMKYTDIFEANKGTLTDPNVVEVGQKLSIPLKAEAPSLNA